MTLGISFSGKAIIVDSLFLNNLLHETKMAHVSSLYFNPTTDECD